MPGSRRKGRLVVAVLLVAAVGVVGGLVATGRAPLLKRKIEVTASSAAALVASYAPSLVPPADAGAPDADADAEVTYHRQSGPLSNAQLGAPLVHGTFVSACGAPDDMKVTLKVSVKYGRAVGVSVKTMPPNQSVALCIERATKEMHWDVSPHVGQVTVTY